MKYVARKQHELSPPQQPRSALHEYFDFVWKMFVRLEKEGKLDELNLTGQALNPTVKPPSGDEQ